MLPVLQGNCSFSLFDKREINATCKVRNNDKFLTYFHKYTLKGKLLSKIRINQNFKLFPKSLNLLGLSTEDTSQKRLENIEIFKINSLPGEVPSLLRTSPHISTFGQIDPYSSIVVRNQKYLLVSHRPQKNNKRTYTTRILEMAFNTKNGDIITITESFNFDRFLERVNPTRSTDKIYYESRNQQRVFLKNNELIFQIGINQIIRGRVIRRKRIQITVLCNFNLKTKIAKVFKQTRNVKDAWYIGNIGSVYYFKKNIDRHKYKLISLKRIRWL